MQSLCNIPNVIFPMQNATNNLQPAFVLRKLNTRGYSVGIDATERTIALIYHVTAIVKAKIRAVDHA